MNSMPWSDEVASQGKQVNTKSKGSNCRQQRRDTASCCKLRKFVRQLVKAAFAAKAKKSKTIADFPPKIAGTVWRRSLELLARTPFDEIEANAKTHKLSTGVGDCLFYR
jgi:hypothetical protein